MKVRKASKEDALSLINLYTQLLPNDSFNIVGITDFIENVAKSNDYFVLVLEDSNKIVATCTLIIIKNMTHKCRPFGVIENVVTDLEFRRHGFGKIILDEAIKIAINNRCHKVMVQTRQKHNYIFDFYSKCGFSSQLSKGFMINLEEKNE